MKTCADVMTKDPVCALPEDSVRKVAEVMRSQDIGPVPIVDSLDRRLLVGIVTDRDLALKVVAEGRDADTTPVGDVMTRDLVSCREDDDVSKALNAMSNMQLRRIPVVDRDGRIVGIIAQADVATRLDEPEKTGEVVKDISE